MEIGNTIQDLPVSSGQYKPASGFRNDSHIEDKFIPELLATLKNGLLFMLRRRGALDAYEPILKEIAIGMEQGRFAKPEDLAAAAHRLVREVPSTLSPNPDHDGRPTFSVNDLGLTKKERRILSDYYGARMTAEATCERHKVHPDELKALGRRARTAARRLTEES